ncbi:unnamed protein product, partial [Brassica oleracea var. botrytis]
GGVYLFSYVCTPVVFPSAGYPEKYELWCRFAGKPIRYAIGDFAVVTGLNCGT